MKSHLMKIINYYWRPLVIKRKCEKCSCTESLELHHMDSFRNFMHQYNIPEDKNLLSNEEIKYYEYICLGYHLKEVKSTTLCNECHKELHKHIGWTGIRNQRRIHTLPIKERDRLIVKLYANTNLSASIIAKLTKKDIIESNFINRHELMRYVENKEDYEYVFTGQKNTYKKPLSRQHIHLILRQYVTF